MEPSSTFRFKFPVQASAVLKKTGYCDFTISQHGTVSTTARATFDATNYVSGTPIDRKSYLNTHKIETSTCLPPNIVVTTGNRKYCQQACPTDDTKFDPNTKICAPVDCVSKYQGYRNFFNVMSNMCEATKKCSTTETYDSLHNACIAATTTPTGSSTTAAPTTTPTPVITTTTLAPETSQSSSTASLECSNGVWNSDHTQCACNAGWITPASSYLFCSQYAPVSYANYDTGSSSSDDANTTTYDTSTVATGPPTGIPSTLIYIIVGASVGVGLFVLLVISIIVCICVGKRRRRKRKEREQAERDEEKRREKEKRRERRRRRREQRALAKQEEQDKLLGSDIELEEREEHSATSKPKYLAASDDVQRDPAYLARLMAQNRMKKLKEKRKK